jgi:hypothetical protein
MVVHQGTNPPRVSSWRHASDGLTGVFPDESGVGPLDPVGLDQPRDQLGVRAMRA